MKITKRKIFMNLEIKDPRIDLVFPCLINLIKKYDYFDQISISSFEHKYYNKIMEYNSLNKFKKIISFGFLYGLGNNNIKYNFKFNTINLYWSVITKEICDKAHANGMAVFIWFIINDKESEKIYERLFDYGVDILCTNYPLKAKKFRYHYYKKRKI